MFLYASHVCFNIVRTYRQALALHRHQRTYWEGFPSNGDPSLDIEQRRLWFQSHTLCSVGPASEPAGCPKCCLCARQSRGLRSDTTSFQKHIRPQNLLGIWGHVLIRASWTDISFLCRSATQQHIFVQCNFETCDSPDDKTYCFSLVLTSLHRGPCLLS